MPGIDSAGGPRVCSARINHLMRSAECGIEGLALARPVAFPVRPQHYNSAFHTPHSAFRFVNWFNAVDATYQADLRELNELNFARFEAKLGERLAQLESHLTWRMFAFWAPTAIAVIATGAGVISLLLRH